MYLRPYDYNLRHAPQIATRMVLQYGWGPDDSPAVHYATNAVNVFLIFHISIPFQD